MSMTRDEAEQFAWSLWCTAKNSAYGSARQRKSDMADAVIALVEREVAASKLSGLVLAAKLQCEMCGNPENGYKAATGGVGGWYHDNGEGEMEWCDANAIHDHIAGLRTSPQPGEPK